jgi:asparagine synthase (glutamine-hydrolysing)
MCGIVGAAAMRGGLSLDIVTLMRDTLRHRGPDDEGAWCSPDGRVALGHRRLAVVDLSVAGRQPMTDAGGRIQIVFNGEIYNYRELRRELEEYGHRFRTRTDTEVIVEGYRRWNVDVLRRLDGMFALALYDARVERLLLAKDPAGEKPLFYRADDRGIRFASELKAIFTDPACTRVLDVEALEYYLAFGYVPGNHCLVRGIDKLMPGHALTFDVAAGVAHTSAYWTLPAARAVPPAATDAELTDRLDALLAEAVQSRMVADVPIGVMLSGGIDSSLVTAMAARASSKPVKTFTISFPGHGAFDEGPYARTVASHFGTEHCELVAEPATVDLLPALARQFDEPIADSSMVPTYLVSRLIRREASVALGGDGADELFGGYPHHSWVQSHARTSAWIPSPVRHALRMAARRAMPVGMKGRNYVLALAAEHADNLGRFNVVFDADARQRLLSRLPSHLASDAPERYKAALVRPGESPLRQITALDFQTYLVDDILVKVDRASMLCGLEVRAPFLDPRVIEFAFADVADRLRTTARTRKVLLRHLAKRLLPPNLDLARKQGFSVPLADWFKGEWGRMVEQVLTAPDALFDQTTVGRLLKGQRLGLANTHRLFALTMIELWRREYRIESPAG